MTREYRLTIEFCDTDCFCHWDYDPPVKNCGGGMAAIGPGGSFGGFSYQKLRELGPGTHEVAGFDERIRSSCGEGPGKGVDRRVHEFRFALFNYACGCISQLEMINLTLEYVTPETIDQIAPLVHQDVRELLRDWLSYQPPDVLPPEMMRLIRGRLVIGLGTK